MGERHSPTFLPRKPIDQGKEKPGADPTPVFSGRDVHAAQHANTVFDGEPNNAYDVVLSLGEEDRVGVANTTRVAPSLVGGARSIVFGRARDPDGDVSVVTAVSLRGMDNHPIIALTVWIDR